MFVVALYKGHGGYRDSSHFRSFVTFRYIATWDFNEFIVELKLKQQIFVILIFQIFK